MITKEDVSHFKLTFCDENKTIAQILKEHLSGWVEAPILDVGCGLGDIVSSSFPLIPATLLDRLDYSEFSTQPPHRRLTMDFFDYQPEGSRPQTLLFSHVLQFLDDRREELDHQVARLSASKIITVLNKHTGTFGKIIDQAVDCIKDANPEVDLEAFPNGYSVVKELPFEAHLVCEDWAGLARQVGYLLDAKPSKDELLQISEAARSLLTCPTLTIPQAVRAYERTV